MSRKPTMADDKKGRNIDVDLIYTLKKEEEPLLAIADLVAHSLYKCVDKSENNFGIVEPRYVREMAPRFFGEPETQKVIGAGIYCVHSVNDMRVDPEVMEVFENLRAKPPGT